MSTRYMHFTKEQKQIARQVNIAEMLRSQGEALKHSGSEYEWKDGGQKVTIRGNLWYHQYEQVGGDAVDFVRKFYGKSYPEAVKYLLSGLLEATSNSRNEIVQNNSDTPAHGTERKIEFKLPKASDNMRRVFAYLVNRRGIDSGVLSAFVHAGMIYESADYHNAVFVGVDKDGIARHAHKRGTGSQSSYKGNVTGSQPEYSFHHIGVSDKLYLFEAPVDMLSFISMNKDGWEVHSYAASCSVSDRVLFQCLKDNPNIQKVSVCFDSDQPGQTAAKRITDKLSQQGIQAEILVPKLKDWNEDRQTTGGNFSVKHVEDSIFDESEKKLCPTLQL